MKTEEEKTIVCDCNSINYKEIKDAVAEFGTDLEVIMDETTAGTVCGQCLEGDCDIVDLPLPCAIERAKEELAL